MRNAFSRGYFGLQAICVAMPSEIRGWVEAGCRPPADGKTSKRSVHFSEIICACGLLEKVTDWTVSRGFPTPSSSVLKGLVALVL